MVPTTPAIVELLADVLRREGLFRAKRMFGGHGLYLDGQFFAILDGDKLYFKVDKTTQSHFEKEGMSPFTYETKTATHALWSYWRVPERLFDEPDELITWVRHAVGAARASTGPQKASPKKETGPGTQKTAQKSTTKTGQQKKPRAGGARKTSQKD